MFLILPSLNAMSTTWKFYTSLFIMLQEVQKLKLHFPDVSIYCHAFTHGHLRFGPSFPSSFANLSSFPKSATHVCIIQARTYFWFSKWAIALRGSTLVGAYRLQLCHMCSGKINMKEHRQPLPGGWGGRTIWSSRDKPSERCNNCRRKCSHIEGCTLICCGDIAFRDEYVNTLVLQLGENS